MGGVLGEYGSRTPFFAAAGLCLINGIYGYFVIPESLKPENRRTFSWKNANPIGAFVHIKSYPIILPLIICIFLINIAANAVQSTWSYYTMEKYHWDERMVGLSLGFVGTLLMIVQAGLIRIAIPKFGLQKSIIIGLCLYMVAYSLFGFATESWMMYASSIFFVSAGIAGPALQSYISYCVPQNEQGQIQGGITSVISLTSIIGPLVMTTLFSYFS